MSLIIKIACPEAIITASDKREVYSKEGKKISHFDEVQKSFLKGKFSIAICGNAFIGPHQIKDMFSGFLGSLDDNIGFEDLVKEIIKLYSGLTELPSTEYLISFYIKISQESKYKDLYEFEPLIYSLKTEKMEIRRLNLDEDGFTYGFFWRGETDKISSSLKEKRTQVDAKKLNIESTKELIAEIFNEVQSEFEKSEEYPTVSDIFDLTIETPNEVKLIRNFNTEQ